ncbi:hypothetical protein HDU86_006589 [Geranomyces michiganensis]|nr:hypothetical protein HDU86_006589 [Geranomyces michiganensis]
MATLTKLDFHTLESSGTLDSRSWVWELRQVQVVFATMVKAFAGAIKKNRAFVQKNYGPTTSSGLAARNTPARNTDRNTEVN